MTETASDAALVERVRDGDRGALDALLARHAPTVMRFALKMCREVSDAEDVLQETLAAAARGLGDLRGEAALSTWLYTVARSFCIKKRRRGKHAPSELVSLASPEGEAIASRDAAPDEAARRREVAIALDAAMDTLDDASREVVVLRDVEGLSASETAAVTGTSVDAVKSRLHRARAQLRRRLALLASDEATVPSDPACPDIVDVLSHHLEGDVGPEACAAMEAHVATCRSCSAACDLLRTAVGLCGAARDGALSSDVEARVRRAVSDAVASRH